MILRITVMLGMLIASTGLAEASITSSAWVHHEAEIALNGIGETHFSTDPVAGTKELKKIFAETIDQIESLLIEASVTIQNTPVDDLDLIAPEPPKRPSSPYLGDVLKEKIGGRRSRSRSRAVTPDPYRTVLKSRADIEAEIAKPLREVVHLIVGTVSAARRGVYTADLNDWYENGGGVLRKLARFGKGVLRLFSKYAGPVDGPMTYAYNQPTVRERRLALANDGGVYVSFGELMNGQKLLEAEKDGFGETTDRRLRLEILLVEEFLHPIRQFKRRVPAALEPFMDQIERLVVDRNLLKGLAPKDCADYL